MTVIFQVCFSFLSKVDSLFKAFLYYYYFLKLILFYLNLPFLFKVDYLSKKCGFFFFILFKMDSFYWTETLIKLVKESSRWTGYIKGTGSSEGKNTQRGKGSSKRKASSTRKEVLKGEGFLSRAWFHKGDGFLFETHTHSSPSSC